MIPVRRTALQNATTADGDGKYLDCDGIASAGVRISGTFVADVNFEGTVDDSDWFSLTASNVEHTEIRSIATQRGNYEIDVSYLSQMRARISDYANGTVTVEAIGKIEGGPVQVETSVLAIDALATAVNEMAANQAALLEALCANIRVLVAHLETLTGNTITRDEVIDYDYT